MRTQEMYGKTNEAYVESERYIGDVEIGKRKTPEDIPNGSSVGIHKEDPSERRSRLLSQGFKMFLASLGKWTMGSMVAFPSVLANDMTQHNTTIFGQPISFTNYEMDLTGSVMILISLIGAWAMAPLMVLFGRRLSMLFSGILQIFGWIGVVLFPGVVGLLIARGVSGFAVGCMTVAVNTYAIEVPDTDVRGVMFIINNTGVIAGQVVTMALGIFFRYYTVALINIILPVTFAISYLWLPESPSFLVVKGRIDKARKVILELRGPHADIDSEIKSYEELNQSTQNAKGIQWRQLLQPNNLKSLLIVCTLFIIMNFSGYLVVTANASRMFSKSGSVIDDNVAALIVTVVQLCASIVASFLIDRLGRRKSLFLSYSLMSIALASLSIYEGFIDNSDTIDNGSEAYGWVPVVCLMVSQASVVIGANPIPFIVSNEYFPTALRSQASSLCYATGAFCGFVVLQLYTPMSEGLTQAGLYAFYALVCALGLPFSYFFVRETMGKNVG